MINHYSAFISYKHADLDNKIAAEIARSLEHYHIPKKIQKATGMKKIDRIFRDKDELPITNDLNDTISVALKNADYLIVICSTNTCKSAWVQKEIEIFLQNHTMNQILTVLADGEPYDVIPKILLTGKRNIIDENGEARTIEVPLEPLSCDYRLPLKKARAEELPRLASALIGCSYDELMNRQRQYKMRRLTAIFAGAMALTIGFAGYMVHSNRLIHDNYIESLRSQSKSLASQSLTQLDADRRIDAMHLALAALPSEEHPDMPITPEAEKAIIKSTYSYISLSSADLAVSWNYSMPNTVTSFKLSDDGSKLAAKDKGETIKVWDTASHDELLSLTVKNYETVYEFFDSNTFIVIDESYMYAFDLTSGETIWRIETDKNYYAKYLKYTNDSFFVISYDVVQEYSVKDGSILNEFSLPGISEDAYVSIAEVVLSKDNTKLAYTIGEKKDDPNADVFNNRNFYIYEYDLETKEAKSQFISDSYITNITYIDDNSLYFSSYTGGMNGSTSNYGYSYTTEDHSFIYCFNSGDLTQRWVQDFVTTNVSYKSEFIPLSDTTILYYSGNTGYVFDTETGEILQKHNTNDSIIDGSNNANDGVPLYVTRTGRTAYPRNVDGKDGISSKSGLKNDLQEVEVNKSLYAREYLSKDINAYSPYVGDDEWTKMTGCPVADKSPDYYHLEGNALALLYKSDDGTDLVIFDTQEKKYVTTINLCDDSTKASYTILGIYNNAIYMSDLEKNPDGTDKPFYLAKYDLRTKELTKTLIDENFSTLSPMCQLIGNKLVYYNNHGYRYASLDTYDLETEKMEETALEDNAGLSAKYLMCYEKPGLAYCITNSMESGDLHYLIDFKSGKSMLINLPDDWKGTTYTAITDSGDKIALTDGNYILVKTIDGETIGTIPCNNVSPLGMTYYNDKTEGEILLVVYSNGSLARYNAENCEYIATSDLTVYANSNDAASFDFDEENGYLYVMAGGMYDVFNLDRWYELAAIPSCFGRDVSTDTFITVSYQNSSERYIGYFKHYTTEDLINKAKEILNGQTMSEDKKAFYGIG